MDKLPVTVMIFARQAARFDLLKKRQELEERATLAALEEEGKERREARKIVARMRPREWPPIESYVAAAVDQRLCEPDLAGPWRPLTDDERAELALSGRWPGPGLGGLVQRNYSLPEELVIRLRTAAWRMSEDALRELRRRRLLGAAVLGLDETQRLQRAELVARLYPVPRIVREALTYYGPTADPRPGDQPDADEN